MDWLADYDRSQLQLGRSPQNTLCLVTPVRETLPETKLGRCFISTLPDELLLKILKYLSPFHMNENTNYTECLAILFVCQHWRRISEPIIYHSIDLHPANPAEPSRKTTDGIRRFLKSVKSRPELSDLVRAMCLRIQDANDIRLATNVITLHAKTRKLSLCLTLSPEAWPLLHAISQLHCLEVLKLWPREGGIAIQMILTLFNMPTLKELRVSRYGLSQDGRPAVLYNGYYEDVQKPDESFSPSLYESAVTALHLDDPATPPINTKMLLQWPRRLVTLSFYLIHSSFALYYTVSVLQQLLDTQRDSLEHIELGFFSRAIKGIPNFSKFSNLRTLKLSANNLFTEDPHPASIQLSTPSLRQLEISFCSEDQHAVDATEFNSEHLIWMEVFVSSLTSRMTTRSGGLETVSVGFDDDDPYCFSTDETPVWPWEYLERAAQALSQYGVLLSYCTPKYSRQEWPERVRYYQAAFEGKDDDSVDDPDLTGRATDNAVTPVTGPGAIDFYYRPQQ